MTIFTAICSWLPSPFSIAIAFFKLPKLETWKDRDKFYVYLDMLINSDFLRLLVEKTSFYLDDLVLQKLQILIQNKEGFDAVYDVISGIAEKRSLPDSLQDLWNFVSTVMSVRSLL
jgi:hypothetical protein